MRTPDLSWETDYRHDRRAHRHRCLCCNKIVNEGERVVMAKVADRVTRTLHIECAGKRAIPESDWTYRQLIEAQAKEHLIKLGFRFPEVRDKYQNEVRCSDHFAFEVRNATR